MILGFARRRQTQPAALYGQLVAQARRPVLYEAAGVPDTVDGRFDMIVLHAWLLFRRLGAEGDRGRALSQEIFELFLADMEGSLREMGVGDRAVPKKVKRMTEMFYGRVEAYDAGLGQGPEALARALARNILDDETRLAEGARLAAYASELAAALQRQEASDLLAGRLRFPEPAAPEEARP